MSDEICTRCGGYGTDDGPITSRDAAPTPATPQTQGDDE